jgi:hypothetical protein
MRMPAGTLTVTPVIGSRRSFGTAKLIVVTTPVGRDCGTGTTWPDALDATRAPTTKQTASAAARTSSNHAHALVRGICPYLRGTFVTVGACGPNLTLS